MSERHIIVCGGRDYSDFQKVIAVLDREHRKEPIGMLVEGGASGADRLARAWAVVNDVDIWTFPADWQQHGKSAGPIRNQQMLDQARPELVIAFPGGTGTAHMVTIARAAGIPVYEVNP